MTTIVRYLAALLLLAACGSSATPDAKRPEPASQSSWKELLEQASRVFQTGDYAGATKPAEDALQAAQAELGVGDAQLAQPLTMLAVIYFVQNRYDAAEKSALSALALVEADPSASPQMILDLTKILGVIYLQAGRLVEAEPLMKKALAMAEKLRGPSDPEVAKHLGNLGALYQTMGDTQQATVHMQRALDIWKEHGANPHYALAVMANLARIYAQAGEDAKARSLFEEALELARASLPKEHPERLATVGHYASFLRERGELKEASALELLELLEGKAE